MRCGHGCWAVLAPRTAIRWRSIPRAAWSLPARPPGKSLATTSVADGNTDTFVAKYDANGNQTWVKQFQTLNQNQAAAISVDLSGNVYVGGQVNGVLGKGQTKIGGADAYVAKLDGKGNIVYEQQFGTSGADNVGGW